MITVRFKLDAQIDDSDKVYTRDVTRAELEALKQDKNVIILDIAYTGLSALERLYK